MKILFIYVFLKVAVLGFLTVILLLREDVIILYLCTCYMKHSVFQCCNFSILFSPHPIPGKRNVVDFIHTKDVIFLILLVVEVHVIDLIISVTTRCSYLFGLGGAGQNQFICLYQHCN